jgi:hypothetical protein
MRERRRGLVRKSAKRVSPELLVTVVTVSLLKDSLLPHTAARATSAAHGAAALWTTLVAILPPQDAQGWQLPRALLGL